MKKLKPQLKKKKKFKLPKIGIFESGINKGFIALE